MITWRKVGWSNEHVASPRTASLGVNGELRSTAETRGWSEAAASKVYAQIMASPSGIYLSCLD